jgi:predicted lipoprotein with Yx(FWY)xxD motif
MSKRSMTIAGIVIILAAAGGLAMLYMSKANAISAKQAGVTPVDNAVVLTKSNAALGQYLTDPNGKPLYTYSGDSAGMSNCTGACLVTWPAYVDTGSTAGLPANIGTIKRSDNGKVQYTYGGLPLYYFIGDLPGHINGNGISGFHIAKPMGATLSTTPTPTPSQATAKTATQAPVYTPAATPVPASAYTPAPTTAPATSPSNGSGW